MLYFLSIRLLNFVKILVINMKINLTSVFVENQEEALKFYVEKLGFLKKTDFPLGKDRWLTVVSPESPHATELLLEPNSNPIAKNYQQGLFAQGIPAMSLESIDIQEEYRILVSRGVIFRQKPTDYKGVLIEIFDDTCGNLIQIHQKSS